jgi:hypothetical protein
MMRSEMMRSPVMSDECGARGRPSFAFNFKQKA